MLSIAVCDDEIMECCDIAKRIRVLCEEMGVLCEISRFENGETLVESDGQYDLIFLDILMSGRDGMQTAQLLRDKKVDALLVFISASREYVFSGYDVEAFSYLVKPVEVEKLKHVLERAVKKLKQTPKEFLLIKRERQRMKLFLHNVYYFEIRGRVIFVHCREGVFDFYERIGLLEQELTGKGFFRCHKGFLVNLDHVLSYDRQELTLDNGENILIAKRRYDSFCSAFLAFIKQNGGVL